MCVFNDYFVVYPDVACEHAEGGLYIAPEFLLGQVYDGAAPETVVLYRPVYVAVRKIQDDDSRNKITSTPTSKLNCNEMK